MNNIKLINVDNVMYEIPQPVAEYFSDFRDVLQGWMFDHGGRCRICMDRSQSVIKRAKLVERMQEHCDD